MGIVGVQEKNKLAASTTEPMASIGAVAAGQTVQIIVQAVNGNLQEVASEPVTYTVPLAKSAGYRSLATTDEAPAKSEVSNGNGNGHSRPARVA